MTPRLYADREGLPLDGAAVAVTRGRVHADDCARCETGADQVIQLTRTLRLDGDLDGGQRAALLEVAGKCPVHRTLEGEIDVVTVAG